MFSYVFLCLYGPQSLINTGLYSAGWVNLGIGWVNLGIGWVNLGIGWVNK